MITRTFIFGLLLCVCLCIAVVTFLLPGKHAHLEQIKPGMTAAQVETIMGRPSHIEASETADQNLTGEVDHYIDSGGESCVIFVNHLVFKTEYLGTLLKP